MKYDKSMYYDEIIAYNRLKDRFMCRGYIPKYTQESSKYCETLSLTMSRSRIGVRYSRYKRNYWANPPTLRIG